MSQPWDERMRLARATWQTLAARLRTGPLRPGWSFAFERAIRLMQAGSRHSATFDLRTQRARFEAEMPPPPPIAREAAVGGVPGRLFEPEERDEGREVLYLHGGGFFEGSSRTHAELIGRLARAARARVFAADYRLAPEHPFPAGLDDAVAAYRGLLAAGAAPSRLLVAGDSAGANLAVGVLLRARGELPLPAGAVLLSPWVELTDAGGSFRSHQRFDWPAPGSFAAMREAYGGDPMDPLVSPARADLAGLPPLRIEVGDAELLHDQVCVFAARAQAAGVEVDLQVLPDMVHTAHSLAGHFPACQRLVEATGAWMQARTQAAGR